MLVIATDRTADCYRTLHALHVTSDALASRLLSVRRVLPLVGRAMILVARGTCLYFPYPRVETVLALRATLEGRVINVLAPVTRHARIAILETKVTALGVVANTRFEDGSRRVASDAVRGFEVARR